MSLRRLFSVIVFAAIGAALLTPSDQAAAPTLAKRAAAGFFPGGPYFALGCGFSHRNNDDPIVFPRQPGRSHNHTYIGNRLVDASSTPASLIGEPTSCESDSDSSTYWVPTLYIGSEPILPLVGIVYYVRRTSEPAAPLPAGLKMVAGDANARRAQAKGIVAWSCGGVGGTPRYSVVPACSEDRLLQLQVNFPNCWNGKAVDSSDHKRHMAYASGGRCPASHPVAVSTIALILLYPPVPARAQVASGRFAAHADFINGWDQEELARLVAGRNY